MGVVGCGAIGCTHIDRITRKLSGAIVVGVTDVVVKAAQTAALICNAKIYKTANRLIGDSEIDAVIITTPHFAHKEPLLAVIAERKPVFCEKPLTATAEDCMEIVKAETSVGKKLIQVGFMRRYDQGYRQLKKVIDSGELGAPLISHCAHRNPQVNEKYETMMSVNDVAIHEIDCMRWILGDDYESVQVIKPRSTVHTHQGLVDPQIMLLRTKGGVCIDIEVFLNCQFGYDIKCEVVCENGTVRMADPISPHIRKGGMNMTALETNWGNRFVDAYDIELQEWIDSARKDKSRGPSSWDGYVAAVTSNALIRSQMTGSVEAISLDMMPALYKVGNQDRG